MPKYKGRKAVIIMILLLQILFVAVSTIAIVIAIISFCCGITLRKYEGSDTIRVLLSQEQQESAQVVFDISSFDDVLDILCLDRWYPIQAVVFFILSGYIVARTIK